MDGISNQAILGRIINQLMQGWELGFNINTKPHSNEPHKVYYLNLRKTYSINKYKILINNF